VNCDYAVQKLLEKDLVVISGRNEDAVGKPLIYATSKSFMDYFGINSAEELPKISEVLMEELVNATNVQDAKDEQEAFENAEEEKNNNVVVEEEIVIEENPEAILAVTENGEIVETTDTDNADTDKEEEA
jgi:segregation and condensation protein B